MTISTITSISYPKKIRIWLHRKLIRMGFDTRKLRSDRKLLERTIFPAIQSEDTLQDILFVGCDWYTLHYPSVFVKKRFATLEIDPEMAKYGAGEHHIASCERIGELFPENSLDCIVLNGVFGFGLNSIRSINKTFDAMLATLRSNGLIVFGWNDLPDRTPCPLSEIQALTKLVSCRFAGLESIHVSHEVNRHRFHFYRKPCRS